jgi:hypothetical protein
MRLGEPRGSGGQGTKPCALGHATPSPVLRSNRTLRRGAARRAPWTLTPREACSKAQTPLAVDQDQGQSLTIWGRIFERYLDLWEEQTSRRRCPPWDGLLRRQ